MGEGTASRASCGRLAAGRRRPGPLERIPGLCSLPFHPSIPKGFFCCRWVCGRRGVAGGKNHQQPVFSSSLSQQSVRLQPVSDVTKSKSTQSTFREQAKADVNSAPVLPPSRNCSSPTWSFARLTPLLFSVLPLPSFLRHAQFTKCPNLSTPTYLLRKEAEIRQRLEQVVTGLTLSPQFLGRLHPDCCCSSFAASLTSSPHSFTPPLLHSSHPPPPSLSASSFSTTHSTHPGPGQHPI
ncbi:hypothetical protein B0J13DRAFT_282974 [Dactylonectria estremocensis]|uniref:Uncharacterized protein n=1 Tax=Dactylonectria estremocensis TaxID=1079267 RepID=A0A9P9J974_9HYPO|nr:hypothetical protein B0J13DRAFT_282974 [Dactylonectria estremocensis]